jgi:hypothetical protein
VTLQNKLESAAMRHLTLSIPDKDYAFFMTLIKRLDFVNIEENKSTKDAKQDFLDDLKGAVEEVKQIKAGKLKGRPLKDLLDEL